MKKRRFLKRGLSGLLSAFLLLSGLPISLAAQPGAGTEEERFLPTSEIREVTASSYQSGYDPIRAFDGIENDENNCWHTPWGENMDDFPHWIMAEFTAPQSIDALVYIPRDPVDWQFATAYEVWISPDTNEENLQKVAAGTWERGERGVAEFPAQEARLVKFVILEKVDANQNPEDTSMAVAELKFRMSENAGNRYVSSSQVKGVRASSYQSSYEPEKAFDGIEGDPSNCWHTPWEENMADFPHWIMAEFETPQYIDGLVYVPRGPIDYPFATKYEVWVSPDTNEENLQKVAAGTWERGFSGVAEFPAQEAGLVKFVILEKDDPLNGPDNYSVSVSEIKCRLVEETPIPPPESYVPVTEIVRATASSQQLGYEPEKAFDGGKQLLAHPLGGDQRARFPTLDHG